MDVFLWAFSTTTPLYYMSQKFLLTLSLLFILQTGFAQTYTGPGGIINDDGSINDFLLEITDLSPGPLNADHGLRKVCVDLTHTWVADLDIRLISPSGVNLMLTSTMGGDGDNYQNTCFVPESSQHILDGLAPYEGDYLPFTSIGNVNNNQSGIGTWTLRILDTYAYADYGEVLSWNLEFGEGAPAPDLFEGTSLPIVLLHTDHVTVPNEPKIPGTIKVIFNGGGGLNHPDSAAVFESNMAIEVRGSSSQGFPKKSYGFETQDAEGDDFETELLGLPKEEDWILYAPYTDKTFLRDALTYKLGNDFGGYAPRTVACEMFLNGDYQGVYWLEEKIKRDKNRVNIKKLNPVDTIGDALTGGYILKVDRDDGEGTYFVSNYEGTNPDEEIRVVYEDPEGPDLHPRQKEYIQDFYHDFEAALYGDYFTDPVMGYRRYVDVASLVDYFIVCELGHNVDAYRLSTFFYKDRNSVDSLFHLGPLWDFNLAYGNVNYCESQYTEGWAYEHSSACGNTPLWWPRFLEDPYFRDRLRCRYDSLRETVLSNAALIGFMDDVPAMIGSGVDRNYDKWPILGRYIWPNFFIGHTYQEEINFMKQWLIGRLLWMDENIPGDCEMVSTNVALGNGEYQVTPNPAKNTFRIQSKSSIDGQFDLVVTNATGVECILKSSVSLNNEIDISALTTGIYFVMLTQDNRKIFRQRFVVAD